MEHCGKRELTAVCNTWVAIQQLRDEAYVFTINLDRLPGFGRYQEGASLIFLPLST